MKLSHILIATILFAGGAVAQTQLVRGDIDIIKNTTGLFRLDCTAKGAPGATTGNLRGIQDRSRQKDIEYEMQVEVVGNNPVQVNVLSAKQIPQLMDMGNLRLSRSDRWQVRGVPNSLAAVFMTATSMTSYLPVGPLGTWVLGGNYLLVNFGTIGATGQFQFSLQPPNLPGLIGQSFSTQALVREPSGRVLITNADCKTVRQK